MTAVSTAATSAVTATSTANSLPECWQPSACCEALCEALTCNDSVTTPGHTYEETEAQRSDEPGSRLWSQRPHKSMGYS